MLGAQESAGMRSAAVANADRDGQIVCRPFFLQVGRGEVDGDPAHGEDAAGIANAAVVPSVAATALRGGGMINVCH